MLGQQITKGREVRTAGFNFVMRKYALPTSWWNLRRETFPLTLIQISIFLEYPLSILSSEWKVSLFSVLIKIKGKEFSNQPLTQERSKLLNQILINSRLILNCNRKIYITTERYNSLVDV